MPKHVTESVDSSITATVEFTTGTCKVSTAGAFKADVIAENTAAAGVTIDSVLLKDNAVTGTTVTATNVIANTAVLTDTVSEKTSATGVTVDGVLCKDYVVTATGVTVGSYYIQTSSSDFILGTPADTDILKVDSNKDLYMTAGSLVLPASEYLNIGGTQGDSGYGFRDNAGVMQYKDSGGAWANFSSFALTYEAATENLYLGTNALDSLTTGDYNIAVGYNAGTAITTGTGNTCVGSWSGYRVTGDNNTCIGRAAGPYSSTGTGNDNVCIGVQSGYSLTSAIYNVLIGNSAGQGLTTSGWNVAIGYGALNGANGDGSCIAIGVGTGGSCTGIGNTMIGVGTALSLTSGTYNTLIGINSGGSLTTGYDNVIIGNTAGTTITSGYDCTFIGANTGTTKTDLSNSIAIGYEALVSDDNKAVIGNSSVSTIGGYAAWSNYCDESLKTEIKLLDSKYGLDFIALLKPREFVFTPHNRIEQGFVAQEVKQALDGIQRDFIGWTPSGNDGLQMVSYELFVVPLVLAVQQLKAEVDELRHELVKVK